MGEGGDEVFMQTGDKRVVVNRRTGEYSFLDGPHMFLDPVDPAAEIPSDSECLVLAEKELARVGLGDRDLRALKVTVSESDGGPVAKLVTFVATMDAFDVGGASRIAVGIGQGGQVVGLFNAARHATPVGQYPLRPPQEALEEILQGTAYHTDAPAETTTLMLNQLRLIYYEPGDLGQEFLQPVYLFSGSATTPEGEQEANIYVPALRQ